MITQLENKIMTKLESRIREQYYIDLHNPIFNINKSFLSDDDKLLYVKHYTATHKEEIKKNSKLYYLKHREEII